MRLAKTIKLYSNERLSLTVIRKISYENFFRLSTGDDFAMTEVENVMEELYETLLHLRYPGIAQAASKDMEDTILGCENRLFLLSWLLTQSPVVSSEEFATGTDQVKLLKWYSNMGICVNADALLGKVPMRDQIATLKNLLLFMKNVLIVEQSNCSEECSVIDMLKKHIDESVNIIPPTCSLTFKLNYNEALRYLKNRRRSLSEKRSSTEDPSIAIQNVQPSAEIFGAHGNNNSASSQESDQEKVVEKFVDAFESFLSWHRKNGDESAPVLWKSMNSHIEKIHSDLVMLKETVRAKDDISKFGITNGPNQRKLPLDEIIESIVIRLEEVNNLHMED